jgi:methyl-accepting chemotaxis protein
MLLKRKVYLSLILAVAAPLAISTLIFSNSIRSNTAEKLAKVDLPTALSEVKSQIELELSTPMVVGKEIAQNLFVQQWMNNNEDAQSRGKFIDYLKHIKD